MLKSHALRGRAFACVLAASVLGAVPVTAQPVPRPAPIVNGAPEYGLPAVGMVVYDNMECSATLVGCQTVLTAAHCLCYDDTFAPPRLQVGDECRSRPELVDPAAKRVFFPHAGTFGVSEITFHPRWGAPGGRYDLAILRLDRPVTGVQPARINETLPVPARSEGTVAGFGRTTRAVADQGIKRAGRVTTSSCTDDFVCWLLRDPVEPPGGDAGLCYHDSGGPLFVDLGAGPVLAGVNYSTSNLDCEAPAQGFATAVYAHREWIVETAGADLGAAACGELPALGGPGTRTDGATGEVSAQRPEALYTFSVPPGTGTLRVGLSATGTAQPAATDVDLAVRHGSAPGPGAPADCTSRGPGSLELCELEAPEAGTWYARVERAHGAGRFQVTVAQFDGAPPSEEPEEPAAPPAGPSPAADPGPPAGPWLHSADLPGFEAKALFHGGSDPLAGAAVADCAAETLCVSGALPGRSELFLKVVGPRPNGFLWVQIARFTPSRVQIWLRQLATGQVNYYQLEEVRREELDLPGRQDRTAFSP